MAVQSAAVSRLLSKWQRNYSGLFLMTTVLGLADVVAQRTARSKPQVVHIDKLKPFLVEAPKSWLVDGTEPTPSEEKAPSESESDQESSLDAPLQSPDHNEDEWPAQSELVQDEEHEGAPRSVVPAIPVDQSTIRDRDASPDLYAAQLESARFRHASGRECKTDDRPMEGAKRILSPSPWRVVRCDKARKKWEIVM